MQNCKCPPSLIYGTKLKESFLERCYCLNLIFCVALEMRRGKCWSKSLKQGLWPWFWADQNCFPELFVQLWIENPPLVSSCHRWSASNVRADCGVSASPSCFLLKVGPVCFYVCGHSLAADKSCRSVESAPSSTARSQVALVVTAVADHRAFHLDSSHVPYLATSCHT